jgi:olfactory receptor
MAYDSYVGICQPLRYTVIMNLCLCVILALVSLSLDEVVYILLALSLPFCTDLETSNIFCKHAHIIKLTPSDL